MDDVPLCPDYWPRIIWDLHFNVPHVHGGGGGNPVNLPVDMNAIQAGLVIHTASYLLHDKAAAQEIRTTVEKHVSELVLGLSKAHDEAMRSSQK